MRFFGKRARDGQLDLIRFERVGRLDFQFDVGVLCLLTHGSADCNNGANKIESCYTSNFASLRILAVLSRCEM